MGADSPKSNQLEEYIASLKESDLLGDQVVFHTTFPAKQASFGENGLDIQPEISSLLATLGIPRLYSHQVEAIGKIQNGKNVVVATPTASGKSLVYNIPVLQAIMSDPSCKALYLFPLKALAQDQLRNFNRLTSSLPPDAAPTAAIYDGDTSPYQRRRIRELMPSVIFTNPEMLNLSLLAYHHSWAALWQGLRFIVVDEVHTYRGILGSHMSWVFRRLNRIGEYYGNRINYIFCSATIGNPGELASMLADVEVEEIVESGAPRGRQHLLFLNPAASPAHAAILLLKAAISRCLRTIVYTQSRKMTELISLWAGDQKEEIKGKISAYRAGYLPEERREIEKKLSSGRLLAVVSTSALELGIDIGNLDICILVGYPGSVMATWQRGGRVGRKMQDSAVILVAQQDALDQYFMRNPEEFLDRAPESAVLNPFNPSIMKPHLVSAAAEIPLKKGEGLLTDPAVSKQVDELIAQGRLLEDGQGVELYSHMSYPQRNLNLRGAGKQFQIVEKKENVTIGSIDGYRAHRETHPGAVYLHNSISYLVDELDFSSQTVTVSAKQVDYYTKAHAQKETEILEIEEEKAILGTTVGLGRLRVTDQVTGYEKRLVRGQVLLGVVPLELPPLIFETEGIWIVIPKKLQQRIEEARLHFMGGIHALEHAAIGILPLLVMTDRNDLGGISIPFHPQIGQAAVFIYDAVPGGVGLSRETFSKAEELIVQTLNTVESCPCEFGCPSCVHSPKCGSGNRPIDKEAAVAVLKGIKNPDAMVKMEREKRPLKKTESKPAPLFKKKELRFGVFDLETQLSAQEVGGWHRADLMRMSCGIVYDSSRDAFIEFLEDQVDELIEVLSSFDMVIGFNIKRFDYKVLQGYSNFDFRKIHTLDMLEEIHRVLGYRLSLDHLAQTTLKARKSANGLLALKWWKQGEIQKIIDYCRQDVALSRDLYLFGREKGHLLFKNKAKKVVRVPVNW